MKGPVKFKKESYRSRLVFGHPKVANSYQQPKQSAAQVVIETKTQVWDEYGEAMKQHFQSTLKKVWQTVKLLRRMERNENGTQSTQSSVWEGNC